MIIWYKQIRLCQIRIPGCLTILSKQTSYQININIVAMPCHISILWRAHVNVAQIEQNCFVVWSTKLFFNFQCFITPPVLVATFCVFMSPYFEDQKAASSEVRPWLVRVRVEHPNCKHNVSSLFTAVFVSVLPSHVKITCGFGQSWDRRVTQAVLSRQQSQIF